MQPPYIITGEIVNLVAKIENLLGKISGLIPYSKPNPELRRQNRIRSIQASLSIEGNSLTEDMISDILEGKRVLGPKQDIQEVQNAIKAYDLIPKSKSNSEKSLLKSHAVLMQGLTVDAGKYRSKNVGIYKGTQVVHFAPQPKLVPKLMQDLFIYLKQTKDHPLIVSSVFHYEFEFIHPFSDGNGRLGRLWQTLILTEFDCIFEYLPIESLIKSKQAKYYKVLAECDKAGESTEFITFMLEIILDVLGDYSQEYQVGGVTFSERISSARENFGDKEFSRKKYMNLFKNISSATASRDLLDAVNAKKLEKIGNKNQTKYKFS